MKSSSIVILTALFIMLGRWAKGQSVDSKIIIGGLFAALVISIMDESAPKLARGFAWLFFVSAVLTYLDPILQGVGAMPGPNVQGQANVVSPQNGGNGINRRTAS